MKRLIATLTPLIVTVALVLSVLLAPRSAQAATQSWSDSLAEVGMPATPQQWQPSNFDVQVHTRDMNDPSSPGNDTHLADHGPDCSAPPAQHTVSTWQDAVFACHSHVMTAIQHDGYGEVVLTPDHMANWSQGPTTVGWSVSTQRTTSRDWISIDITPFEDQLALPFDTGTVDLQGMPKRFIELSADFDNNQTHWRLKRTTSDFAYTTDADEWPYFETQTGIPMSATVRTPFEFTFDSTSYTFRVAPSAPKGAGTVIFSGKWSTPLGFSSGVVQFAHHSYNPLKCDVSAITCVGDTWHWSDFNISSAQQYTLLHPTDHRVVSGSSGVVTFPAAAPDGSFLKFSGLGAIQVSYDGGKTYSTANQAPTDPTFANAGHFANYLSPVPAGATQVQFKMAGGSFGQAMARDFSIVSESLGGSTPPNPTNTPAPPTPTAVPPTPTATSTPAPNPTPIPIQNVPCTVTLPSGQQSGTCSGSFTP